METDDIRAAGDSQGDTKSTGCDDVIHITEDLVQTGDNVGVLPMALNDGEPVTEMESTHMSDCKSDDAGICSTSRNTENLSTSDQKSTASESVFPSDGTLTAIDSKVDATPGSGHSEKQVSGNVTEESMICSEDIGKTNHEVQINGDKDSMSQNQDSVVESMDPVVSNADCVSQSDDYAVQTEDDIVSASDCVEGAGAQHENLSSQNQDTAVVQNEPTIAHNELSISNEDPVAQREDTKLQNHADDVVHCTNVTSAEHGVTLSDQDSVRNRSILNECADVPMEISSDEDESSVAQNENNVTEMKDLTIENDSTILQSENSVVSIEPNGEAIENPVVLTQANAVTQSENTVTVDLFEPNGGSISQSENSMDQDEPVASVVANATGIESKNVAVNLIDQITSSEKHIDATMSQVNDAEGDRNTDETLRNVEETQAVIGHRVSMLHQGMEKLQEMNNSMDQSQVAVNRMFDLDGDCDVMEAGGEFSEADDKLLQQWISKAFKDLGIADILDTHMAEQNNLVVAMEREVAEVNKMFAECRLMIGDLQAARGNEQDDDTNKNAAADTGSDDEIQFIKTTYQTPQMTIQQQLKDKLPPHLRDVVQIRQVINSKGETVIQYYIPSGTPNQEQLKQQLLALRTPPHTPLNLRSIVKPPAPQIKPGNHRPFRYPDLVVGMKLWGKKHNDIWHKATLVEILNRDRPRPERKYKLKFDEKKVMKTVIAKHTAFNEHPPDALPVGSRVIALYKEDEKLPYYAGVVAEPPSARNSFRYLVFFDDGYAQYNNHKEIHKVCEQSDRVWQDIQHSNQGETKPFIQDYLNRYPERPMVRLQSGQKVKTERNGEWNFARVESVDASLVRMRFEENHRKYWEWIYRGSTRLEPLYNELAQQEQSKLRGVGLGRRHFTGRKGKHVIQYTRQEAEDEMDEEDSKKKSVARKSTAKKAANSLFKNDMASVLQERLLAHADPEAGGHVITTNKLKGITRKKYVAHQKCSAKCLEGVPDDPAKFKDVYGLLIPQLCSWERRKCTKKASTTKTTVHYRAPCGRMLRTLNEIDQYLIITNSKLTIDLFSCDEELRTDVEWESVKDNKFCDINDLSYDKEDVKISCKNGLDHCYPEYVEYSTERVPGKDVNMGNSADFRIGCDCTDGCRDPDKCACMRLTLEASKITPNNRPYTGYEHRRLTVGQVVTGVYECNDNCKCDDRCRNRVVQHGLKQRLQVFRTENKGWGARTVNDIPEGSFIVGFTGFVLDENKANEDGQQFGDEYLAELDYIEVLESIKEGYESDVVPPSDDDSDQATKNRRAGKRSSVRQTDEDEMTTDDDDTPGTGSDDSDCSVGKVVDRQLGLNKRRGRPRTKDVKPEPKDVKPIGKFEVISIDLTDDESEPETEKKAEKVDEEKEKEEKKPVKSEETDVSEVLGELKITEPTSLNTDDVIIDSDDETDDAKTTKAPRGPRRSTRAANSRFSMPDPKSKTQKKQEMKSLRSYYDEKYCYVMDAKSKGNIGRYLNHGCDPNVFVQNVFVDSHDLRFPWVSFFAARFIPAGTELCWDYNYEVGSVPGKTLYCYCESEVCRGRLL